MKKVRERKKHGKSLLSAKLIISVICFVFIFCAFSPCPVKADSGPKTSVDIKIKGLEGQNWTMTLLSEDAHPNTAYDADLLDALSVNSGCSREIFQKFRDYAQSDDYYFIGYTQSGSGDGEFYWYNSPWNFKILIYLQDSDSLLVSDFSTEAYSYTSSYTLTIKDLTIQEGGISTADMKLSPVYFSAMDIAAFLGRVLTTLLMEVLLALIFRYRSPSQLRIIVLANLITQFLLNLILNLVSWNGSIWFASEIFLLLEVLVVIIEAFIYCLLPGMKTEGKNRLSQNVKAIIYALLANVLSFLAGEVMFILYYSFILS